MARVVCALLWVAFGALDQAHNTVTPLSWGSPTDFGGVSTCVAVLPQLAVRLLLVHHMAVHVGLVQLLADLGLYVGFSVVGLEAEKTCPCRINGSYQAWNNHTCNIRSS